MDEDTRQLTSAVLDAVRRMAVHYGLWFANAVDRFGIDEALVMEREAGDRGTAIVLDRLCAALGTTMQDGVPASLAAMDSARLQALLSALAVNWLVLDGVWFQAVETREGMAAAKGRQRCLLGAFLAVGSRPHQGRAGPAGRRRSAALQAAFGHRLYAVINEQAVFFEDDGSLVLQMTKCRVQTARHRKGLPDYPCKSGGVVEYTSFARTIDPRIGCECIACPPDGHPDEWVCAWRFRLAPAA